MQRVMAAHGSINQPTVSPISVELWLEVGLALYHFEKGDSGKAAFDAARRAATLHVEMTGALGRRTKFQTSSIAQLVLKATTKVDPEEPRPPQVVERELEGLGAPAPLVETQAEDSILLEHTAFDEQGQGERLACAELCVLLALCLDVRNSNPKHGLTTEQMRPYVERVMAHESNWTVYSTVRGCFPFEFFCFQDNHIFHWSRLYFNERGWILRAITAKTGEHLSIFFEDGADLPLGRPCSCRRSWTSTPTLLL